MEESTVDGAAEDPRQLTPLEAIKARLLPLHYIDTPWGKLGLRKRLSVAGLLACRNALGRDEEESTLLLVQYGVADPRLDRDAVLVMSDEDGEAFVAVAQEVMRSLGFQRVSVEAQQAARVAFREGDPGSVEESRGG